MACDEAFKNALIEAGRDKIRMNGYANAGSCAVIVAIVDDQVCVAHVGDCRAVLAIACSGKGKLFLQPAELTEDHTCSNPAEISLGIIVKLKLSKNHIRIVMNRSSDRKAVRGSSNDQKNQQHCIPRVAGSLAVTRAFGDFYLKDADFSKPPYKVR